MSRVKSPQEKKRLSLENDRRNTYGENKKSSRKNIPRRKRLTQQSLRRSLAVALKEIERSSSEDQIDAAESETRDKVLRGSRAKFRKVPDAPLGAIFERKRVTNRSSYKAMGAAITYKARRKP